MTVQELRALLATFPDDMIVWHDGGGDPYCAGEIQAASIIDRSLVGRMYGHDDDTPDIWVMLT